MKRFNESAKKLLVVVDMVNGFVREGNMADPKISHIIPECERLVRKFLKEGNEVVYIADCHKKGCKEFSKFPVHCLEGTIESEVVVELKRYENEVILVKKNSTSAMFAKGFIDVINQMADLEEVVIIGCCTDICVQNLAIPLANYFDEEERKIIITVPTNAVETYDAPYHPKDEYNAMTFKFMKQTGINLVENF